MCVNNDNFLQRVKKDEPEIYDDNFLDAITVILPIIVGIGAMVVMFFLRIK